MKHQKPQSIWVGKFNYDLNSDHPREILSLRTEFKRNISYFGSGKNIQFLRRVRSANK
jgi:hypothetical protein